MVASLCNIGLIRYRQAREPALGKAGEEQQKAFFDRYDEWIEDNQIHPFYFHAFDEQWKGGFDAEIPMVKGETHWGLYRSDRKPRQVLY